MHEKVSIELKKSEIRLDRGLDKLLDLEMPARHALLSEIETLVAPKYLNPVKNLLNAESGRKVFIEEHSHLFTQKELEQFHDKLERLSKTVQKAVKTKDADAFLKELNLLDHHLLAVECRINEELKAGLIVRHPENGIGIYQPFKSSKRYPDWNEQRWKTLVYQHANQSPIRGMRYELKYFGQEPPCETFLTRGTRVFVTTPAGAKYDIKNMKAILDMFNNIPALRKLKGLQRVSQERE